MGFFSKKRKSTVDFTKMQDAAIPQPQKDLKLAGEAVDLRNNNQDSEISSNTESSTNSGSNIDFLSTMASSASPTSSSSSSVNSGVVNQVSEMSEMKHSMRALTGKVEDASNEVYRLLHRIELLEKKLERFEGRR